VWKVNFIFVKIDFMFEKCVSSPLIPLRRGRNKNDQFYH
jgi:hypothetical protein